jgi:hypothetical protein
MNKARRLQLQTLSDQIAALRYQIEEVATDEEEAFSNLPESLQESEKGQASAEAVSSLIEATELCDEISNLLDTAKGD